MPLSLQGGPEQRVHPRRHVELDITLGSDSQFYSGFSENLSEGGIFVATHDLRPLGTRLEVTFSLPTSRRRIRTEGVVCWVRAYSETSGAPPGIGIRFLWLLQDDALAVRAFCIHRPPLFFTE
jgi:uncharacterized protein (TIGR02266 family)